MKPGSFLNKIIALSSFRIGLILFVLSFMIRMAYAFYDFGKNGEAGFVDDLRYINQAKDILANGVPLGEYQDGPVFPYILSFLFIIFGINYYPVFILNCLLSAGTTVLIFLLGKAVFNYKVALFAALWSLFYILFFRYTGRVLKENLILFLFLFSIYEFVLFARNGSRRRLIVFTVIYLALLHADERFFTFTPFIAGFIFVEDYRHRRAFKSTAVFIILTVVLMIPWTIRNYYVYDRVVILTHRTSIFTDKLFGYDTQATPALISPYSRKNLPLYEAVIDSLVKGFAVKSNIAFLDNVKEAVRNGEPPKTLTTAQNYWEEIKEYWRPCRFTNEKCAYGYRYVPGGWSFGHNLSLLFTYGILLPFFAVGLYFLIINKNKTGYIFAAIILVHFIIHVFLFHVRNRYRIHIDPIIILVGFWGLYNLTKKKKFSE
jgi:hypothetical protein